MSWNIIGWIILVLAGLLVGLFFVSIIFRVVEAWLRYRKTRNVAPEKGQLWRGITRHSDPWLQREHYYVTRVHDNGNVSLSSKDPSSAFLARTAITWTDTAAEWQTRVAKNWLWLTDERWWRPSVTASGLINRDVP